MNDDDDIVLDELFAAARDQRAPPGAEARGWARFEAAIGGATATFPGEATATKLAWLAPAAKIGGVVAVVLALGIVLSEPAPAKRAATVARASDPPKRPAAAATAASATTVDAVPTTVDAVPTLESPAIAAQSPALAPSTPARSTTAPRVTSSRPTPSRANASPEPVTVETAAVEPSRDEPPRDEVVELQRPTAPASPSTADALRIEAELLGRAWVAIREGRAADTRALLAEHARRFPRGALVPEREACQLVARCSAGEPDAIDRARRYLDRHHASHLAARVADGCGLPLPSRADEIE